MPFAKQQRSNVKHGGAIRPNVWVLTFGPPCIYIYIYIFYRCHLSVLIEHVFKEKCVTYKYISNSKINFLMWTGYVNFKTVNLRF